MKTIKSLIMPIIVLILWKIACDNNLFNRILIPSPDDVFLYLLESAKDLSLFKHIFISLRRVFIGFFISVLIAAPAAIVYAEVKTIRTLFYPLIEFIRHIPPLAVLSILILVFGVGELSKVGLIVLSSIFPIFINTYSGISNVDAKFVEVGKSFKLSYPSILMRIKLPASFAPIFSGMQLAMGYSFRSLVGAEIIAATSGLGFLIRNAETFMRMDIVFASIIVLGFLGLFIDYIFNVLSRLFFYKKAAKL